ncbi:uncharacterized protein [Anabrus simplex]|uniref:uncharacterized protein isoform X2 n=1 Tax=Anabrus simplex TaxID=316456 RepID=UPI0034DD7356
MQSVDPLYVKHERFDSDEETLAIPEDGLESEPRSVRKGQIVSQPSRDSLSNAVILTQRSTANHGRETDIKPLANPLAQKYLSNRRNHIRFKVVGDGVDTYLSTDQEEYQLLKDDPRTQMHFVKYIKAENKTVKIWECGTCGKEFRHQYTLMRHLPTHTDERNYKCEICGKAFRQMSTLSQHRAIHSDARPYVCELCKKTFNRVSTLISHRKTHSEHKPHKCGICGKGFHQKGNLRNHIFTHTNERPYKCDICGKGFNQMSNLMCHKAHSHGTKSPFVCPLCNIEFPRKYALRSHEEYKHGIRYRGGIRIQQMDPKSYRELVNRRQKRREEKNLRIIHLPNGDRTLADINDIIPREHDGQQLGGAYRSEHLRYRKEPSDGVLIDPINTRAMSTAKREGQTPFALLKPAKGIPVLVKVMPAANNKQMLVPATAEDLKSAGKITVQPNITVGSSGNGNIKAVQIKVPVVATVIQKVAADGQLSIEVEPPGPEQDLGYEQEVEAETEEADDSMPTQNSRVSSQELTPPSPKVQYVREDGSVIPEEEVDELGSVNLLAATALDVAQKPIETSTEVSPEQGLLELASTGEIQFVRPSGNGFYEVLSQEEAAHIMQQPGQTIQIVDNGAELQRDASGDGERESITNHSNLNALVDAIRAAGYQVTEDHKQIVITPSQEEMTADEAGSAVQHIVYGEPEEVMLNTENDSENLVIEPSDAPIHFILEETGDVSACDIEASY